MTNQIKLKFNSNQKYQIDAINSIVDIFVGEVKSDGIKKLYTKSNFDNLRNINNTVSKTQADLGLSFDLKVVANISNLSSEDIKQNVLKIQLDNKIIKSEGVENNNQAVNSYCDANDFSIEMETGTGKTYVYLRTIFELHKKYNYRKFIIVVPSVAIREGVKNSFGTMTEHFRDLYNTEVKTFIYDSKKLNQVSNFARSNTLEIMIINIDAFTNDERVLMDSTREDGAYIDFIKACNPIVIIDEPQNMETEIRKKAIAKLNPLYTFRYSATHKEKYNLMYRLTPVDAYNQGLVKKIEVASVREKNSFQDIYLNLQSIKDAGGKNKYKVAEVEIEILNSGEVKKKIVKLSTNKSMEDNDLYVLSNNKSQYEGYILREIKTDKIIFANGKELKINEIKGEEKDAIAKAQIEETIKNHFQKELSFRSMGIKVLSLFFLDEVKNYFDHDSGKSGKYAEYFEEIYKIYCEKPEYKELSMPDISAVHDGYFAKDKTGKFKDSKNSKATADDNTAYERILKNKEKLLSFNEPLRFIFSHSALREGWDNPNVFQICVLREMNGIGEKRQTIGRGLRLPVDQNGNRIEDENVNILTVVSNEDYETFAKNLQKEIEEESGFRFANSPINNANKKHVIKLNKNALTNAEFLELWNKIKNKTIYNIKYDSDILLKNIEAEIKNSVEVNKISSGKISVNYINVEMDNENITHSITKLEDTKKVYTDFEIPNIINEISLNTQTSKGFILQIIKNTNTISKLLENPQMYASILINIIKQEKEKYFLSHTEALQYIKLQDDFYSMSIFDTELNSYSDVYEVKDKSKTLYNKIKLDSEVETNFAKSSDNVENVKFFLKLPDRFKIKTPIGNYVPDWALSVNKDGKLYFVAETKSTDNEMERRGGENFKIKCAEKHFNSIVDGAKYKQVKKLEDLFI